MLPFDRLHAGKASYALTLAVYDATEDFPKREWYALAAQIRRCAVSIVLNLSEGSAKRGPREFRRYVDIAIGSLGELVIALRLSRDREFLTVEQWTRLSELSDDTGRLMHRLAQALDRRQIARPSNRLTV